VECAKIGSKLPPAIGKAPVGLGKNPLGARLLASLLFALAWLFMIPTATASPAAIARVEALLASTQSLRASFTQDIRDGNGKLVQNAAGTFVLQKPGRFRWDYTAPAQAIVSDGMRLWFYDADLAQVTVRRQRDVLTQAPAMLLAGKGKVAAGFDADELPPAGGLDWLRLVPRTGAGDFRELRLGFAGTDLREMELVDRLGQRTRIRFTALERNVKLAADTFKFKIPPDTDVVGDIK
jgi:outer membrane lipoprotein carrier protein